MADVMDREKQSGTAAPAAPAAETPQQEAPAPEKKSLWKKW